MQCKQWLERYVEAGLACHWLYPRTKKPKLKEWSTRPVQTFAELKASYVPGDNIGIRTGRYSALEPGFGLVVVDVDNRTGSRWDCYSALRKMLPDYRSAPHVQTGSGCTHIYYACELSRLPEKAAVDLVVGEGWKIELLGTGHNCVAPISIHPNGRQYTWQLWGPIPRLPDGITWKETPKTEDTICVPRTSGLSYGTRIPEGYRRNTLRSYACALQGQGFRDEEITLWTHDRNEKDCDPPMERWEVNSILQWALSRTKGKRA